MAMTASLPISLTTVIFTLPSDVTLTALGRAALPYGTHIALLALRAFQPLDDLPISRRPDTGLSRILHWPYCCLSTCFDSTQKIVPYPAQLSLMIRLTEAASASPCRFPRYISAPPRAPPSGLVFFRADYPQTLTV